jgi:hypothetical protein
MASNIEFNPINENYPVAGQDNNSQGFRDNFSVIKNSFEDAKTEIEDLQDNGARTDQDNEFSYNKIIKPTLVAPAILAYPGKEISAGLAEVSLDLGSYHQFDITTSGTIDLAGWPNVNDGVDKIGRIVVELTLDSGASTSTIEFTSENSGTIKRETSSVWESASTATSAKVELDTPGVARVFEFWSYDNGASVYAKHIGDFE